MNNEASIVSHEEQAQRWAEEEIRAAGLDPDGPEAAFHRFRTRAFGTMGVQPPIPMEPSALKGQTLEQLSNFGGLRPGSQR